MIKLQPLSQGEVQVLWKVYIHDVHALWHACLLEGRIKRYKNLTCVLQYHDNEFFGIGMEDRNTLFGVPASAYKKPSKREIRENRKFMKELRLKYDAAVDNIN
jgi:hypothetical protein